MNRDKIGTQTCYIHQCTNKVLLMYIVCLYSNLHSYAIPTLHFKSHNLLIICTKFDQVRHDKALGLRIQSFEEVLSV